MPAGKWVWISASSRADGIWTNTDGTTFATPSSLWVATPTATQKFATVKEGSPSQLEALANADVTAWKPQGVWCEMIGEYALLYLHLIVYSYNSRY